MEKKVIAFLRVSIPAYNDDIIKNNKLYMNAQTFFHSMELTDGQADEAEGMVSLMPLQLRWSTNEGKDWSKDSLEIQSLSYNPHAYVFCVYAIFSDSLVYDNENEVYTYIVPWSYIKDFWKPDTENEMLITPYVSVFSEKFDYAAEKSGFFHTRAFVQYDLDERLHDPKYIQMVNNDGLTVVFHKKRKHSKENEYRFSILNPNKPQHYELFLEGTKDIYYRIPLKENYSVQLAFQGLIFDENKELIQYSPQIGARFIKA